MLESWVKHQVLEELSGSGSICRRRGQRMLRVRTFDQAMRQHQCSHQFSVERVVEWCQGIFRTKYTANKKIGIAGDPASARGCTFDLTNVRWVKRTHLWCLFCEIASIGRSHRFIHFTDGWTTLVHGAAIPVPMDLFLSKGQAGSTISGLEHINQSYF